MFFSFDLKYLRIVSSPSLLLFLFHFALHAGSNAKEETVKPQLTKLLIYSLFNQINERVGERTFMPPVQLFMVYGNCPKRTRVVSGLKESIPVRGRHPQATILFFSFATLVSFLRCLYHFRLSVFYPLFRFPSAFDSQGDFMTV